MSIDDLAVSLLGRKEKREQEYDRQARKAEKRQRIVAGLGLGVNLINRRLAKRTQEFMNSEPVLQQRLLYRQSVDNKKELEGINSKIIESGKGYHQYFTDDSYNTVYDNYKKKLASLGRATDDISMAKHESLIMDQAKILGQERATAFDAAYQDSRSVGSMKDYDRMIALRNKKPVNLAQWFGMRLKGKTAEDLDNETLASIKNSPLSKYSQEFKDSYESLYKGTKDSAFAFDVASVIPKKEEKENIIKVPRTEIKTVSDGYGGQTLVVVDLVDIYDVNSQEYQRFQKPIRTEKTFNNKTNTFSETNASTDFSAFQHKIVGQLQTSFNFAKQAEDVFTPKGYKAFFIKAKELAEEADLTNFFPTRPKTMQEYNLLAQAWDQITTASDSLQYIEDKTRVEYTSGIISNLAQNPIMFGSLSDILAMKSGEEKSKALKDWTNELTQFMTLLNSAAQTTQVKPFNAPNLNEN
jgi:hypothetical protein